MRLRRVLPGVLSGANEAGGPLRLAGLQFRRANCQRGDASDRRRLAVWSNTVATTAAAISSRDVGCRGAQSLVFAGPVPQSGAAGRGSLVQHDSLLRPDVAEIC